MNRISLCLFIATKFVYFVLCHLGWGKVWMWVYDLPMTFTVLSGRLLGNTGCPAKSSTKGGHRRSTSWSWSGEITWTRRRTGERSRKQVGSLHTCSCAVRDALRYSLVKRQQCVPKQTRANDAVKRTYILTHSLLYNVLQQNANMCTPLQIARPLKSAILQSLGLQIFNFLLVQIIHLLISIHSLIFVRKDSLMVYQVCESVRPSPNVFPKSI
jgi:hypothetical protein